MSGSLARGYYFADGNGGIYMVDMPINMKPTKTYNIATGEVKYPTNYDRITHMTPEELAEWFHERYSIAPWCSEKECPPGSLDDMESCRGCVLDWLKHEVDT